MARSLGNRVRTMVGRRRAASIAALAVGGSLLAACGGGSSTGPVSITLYDQPGSAAATQANADSCTKQSGGKYKIDYVKLPTAADQQRLQLVRRSAARDSSVDIMGLDVTWEAEFAEAGWIQPWEGANEAAAKKDQLAGPLATATWNGKVVAIPYNSNTQLLWYRDDLVKTPPTTWQAMISEAQALAGKKFTNKPNAVYPHYIEEQGAQYEGLTVWFNSMVASAGGSILNKASTSVALGQQAVTALQTMANLGKSSAADPSLSNFMEDTGRLAMEGGNAAFEINYPYVWPSMQSDNPKAAIAPSGKAGPLKDHFKYAPFPSLVKGQSAHSTIGGIDLAISKYTKHSALAFAAATCLADKPNQLVGATQGGLPPTLKSVYTNPAKDFVKMYPFYKLIFTQLQAASVRPKTPAYQSVSIAIQHALSPPNSINPTQALATLKSQISDALNSKGLVP
ncbi:MAG: ABC transporter substrate-binding protein [Mycobacteriales bacterium]